jgi:hypothetical protein
MTTDQFRRMALSFADTVESAHMGHPDFRVRKKIFATLGYPGDGWAMVKLTPAQQEQFVQDHPSIFVPVKGGWGRRGSTNIRLKPATRQNVEAALDRAWRNVAGKRLN